MPFRFKCLQSRAFLWISCWAISLCGVSALASLPVDHRGPSSTQGFQWRVVSQLDYSSIPEMAGWKALFAQASDWQDGYRLQTTVEFFVAGYDTISSDSEKQSFLKALSKYRSQMPYPFRWVFAGLEVEVGKASHKTASDAQLALESVRPYEKMTFGLRPTFAEAFGYRVPGQEKSEPDRRFAFKSSREAIRHYRNWNRIPVVIPEMAQSEFWLEQQIRWMSDLSTKTVRLELSDLRQIFTDFDRAHMKRFSDPVQRRKFLEAVTYLVGRTLVTHGSYDAALSEELVVVGDRAEDYEEVRRYAKKWLKTDIEFQLLKFDFLSRRDLVSPSSLFKQKLNNSDRLALERVIGKSRAWAPGKWMATVLLWKFYQEQGSKVPNSVVEKAVDGLIYATKWQSGVKVKWSATSSEYLRSDFYHRTSWEIYQLMQQQERQLEIVTVSERLSEFRTLETKETPTETWQALELERLAALTSMMERSAAVEFLSKIIGGSQSKAHADRVLAALFLRQRFAATQAEIELVTANFKRANSTTVGLLKRTRSLFTKNTRAKIQILVTLNPKDSELIEFLDGIFRPGVPKNGINPREARDWLAEAKANQSGSIEDLIKRLKVVSTGDSAGDLRTLLSLKPNLGKELIEIIYIHRSNGVKLVEMLKVVVQLSLSNPTIMEALREGMSQVRSEVAEGLYVKKRLDEWLDDRIADERKSRGAQSGRCSGSV